MLARDVGILIASGETGRAGAPACETKRQRSGTIREGIVHIYAKGDRVVQPIVRSRHRRGR